MKHKLRRLFYEDTSSRIHVLGISAMAGSIAGWVAEQNGVALASAAIVSTTIIAVIFFFQLHLYTAPKRSKRRDMSEVGRQRMRSVVNVAAAAVFAAILYVISPYLRAEVLNERLQIALKLPSQREREEVTRQIMAYAKMSGTRIRPQLLNLAAHEIHTPTIAPDWLTFVASANSKLEQDKAKIVILPDASLQNGMELDGKVFTDSEIDGQDLLYKGGPLTLDRFTVYELRIDVAESENGRKLIEAIEKTGGKDMTITLR